MDLNKPFHTENQRYKGTIIPCFENLKKTKQFLKKTQAKP